MSVYKELNDVGLSRIAKNIFAKLKYAYTYSIQFKYIAFNKPTFSKHVNKYKAITA
jgi:hypothetical protein